MVLLLNLWSEALKVMPTLLMQIPNVDSKLSFSGVLICGLRESSWLCLMRGESYRIISVLGIQILVLMINIIPVDLLIYWWAESVNAALRCLVPACDCGPLSLDHIIGSHSDGLIYDIYKRVGCAADLELVLDVHKFSVNFILFLLMVLIRLLLYKSAVLVLQVLMLRT